MATTTSQPIDSRQLDERELRAWRGMLRAHAALTKALDADLDAAHGLPLSSYEVLLYLNDAAGPADAHARPRGLGHPQPLGPDAPGRPPRARGPDPPRVVLERRARRLRGADARRRRDARRGPHDAPRRRPLALPRSTSPRTSSTSSATRGIASSPARRPRPGRPAAEPRRAATRLASPARPAASPGRAPAVAALRACRALDLTASTEISSSLQQRTLPTGGINMALVRWEPVRELTSLQNEMNRLFNTFFDTPTAGNGGAPRRWIPAMDLVETDDHFVLRADLPGLTEEDVQIERRGRRPHRLGRAQGRARGQARGLLPHRALLRLVPPLADAARGRRRRGRRARASTGACSRSASPSPSSASRAAWPSRSGAAAGGHRGRRGRLAPRRPDQPAGPRSARARGRSSAPRPRPPLRARSISASTSASARRRRARSTNHSATPPTITTRGARRARRCG